MPTSTSSFRIPDELRDRLDEAAGRLNKGKNWIIVQALRDYLDRNNQTGLRQEARRQSLLAAKSRWKGQSLWEEAAAKVWHE